MVKYEYNNEEISVPESWDDIQLGVYEKIYMLRPETTAERIGVIATVCNTTLEVLRNWPADEVSDIIALTMFMFKDTGAKPCAQIDVAGVKYIVAVENKLTLGEWVDVDAIQKDGVNVLSGVLSVVCRPVGEKYDPDTSDLRREMFSRLPVSEVLGLLAFFLQCKQVLKQHTQMFSNLAASIDLLPRSILPLASRGAGIKLSLIYPVIKYYILMRLLRFQLRKFSRIYYTAAIKRSPITPSAN